MRNFYFIVFMLSCCCGFAQTPENVNEFREASLCARNVWKEVKPMPSFYTEQVLGPETMNHIKQLQKFPKIGDSGTVDLVLAQSIGVHSRKCSDIFTKYAQILTLSNSLESLIALEYSVRKAGYHWLQYDNQDLIFPIRTPYEADIFAKIKWGRAPFPLGAVNNDFRLAFIFEDIGLYDKAWLARLEEGKEHNGYVSMGDIRIAEDSFYIRTADMAYRAGKKELAWSFLMNAAVLEDEKFFEPAMKTAQLWLDIDAGKAMLPEAKIATGEERKKLFLEIVERYQERNAHPRAWMFIGEYKKEFDEPDALIKKVQDDWLGIVKTVCNPRIAKKIVFYGVQLYPDGADPLSVKIPWAFPKDGMEKLKERLKEEAKKAKEFDDKRF